MSEQMRPSTATKTLLIIAGSFTTAMAAFHFFLPSVAGWAVEVKSIHPTVSWALFSLNFFFSYLLLSLGIISIAGVIWRRTHESMYLAIAFSAAIFWLINGSYQIVTPMPMPARLVLLSYFLKSYAFAVALLYLIPIATIMRSGRKASS